MATERTDGNGEGGAHMTERYTGPSAKRIADLLRHRVSFERGWFWTTTAICHGGKSDWLAFRQRPDGNGIDVHCHTGGCSARVVITELEALIGLPIWTAYEPVRDAAAKAPEKRPWWKRQRVWAPTWSPPGRGGAAYHRRRGALRPEPRRAGHRSAAAPAVHASASGREGPSPLTTGPPAPSYPSQHARVVSIRGRPFFFARKRAQSKGNTTQKEVVMTTATLATGNRTMTDVRPRRRLEELVDRLIAALFKEEEPEAEQATETASVAKSVHEARRLRQAGDVDGALAVLAGTDTTKAEPHQARWAYAEWTDLVKRRFGDRDALVYSQGAGQAAALVPTGNGGTLEVAAVLGMRWRPGKVVSERSLRGLRPLAKACPRP